MRFLTRYDGEVSEPLVGGSTFRRTPISRSPLDKNPMPGPLSELQPVNAVNTKGWERQSCDFHRGKRKKKKAFKGKMSLLLNVARVRGKGDHSEDHVAVTCHI